MRVCDIRRGDIITSRDGRINYVNDKYNYNKYFDSNFQNVSSPRLDIIKIQRFVKVLWFYKLETIYLRDDSKYYR